MKSLVVGISFHLLIFAAVIVPAAQAQTTAFTYQGRLTYASLAPTGQYDFIFRLYNGAGGQVGSDVARDDVQVTNGIFTIQLDFGPTQFLNSAAATIEVTVRPGASTGGYTTLTPRQPLTSAPYAIKSQGADNANLLGGQPPSAYGSSAQVTALQAQVAQLQAELAATTGGTQLWSKALGGTTNDIGYGVAVDGNGDVFITGYFNGALDFGGGSLTSAGFGDIFVAKYSGTTGVHLWSKRFGGTGHDEGRSIAVDGSGNVLVTGNFQATVDFGGLPLTSAGFQDIFLLKLSGTNGVHLWSKRFGGTGDDDEAHGLTSAPNGDVVITGYFTVSADFGGLVLTSAGLRDIFVARYTGATGSHVWSKRFGGAGQDLGRSLATDSSGDVYVTGDYFSPTIDFGGGALTNAGSDDGYLAKLSAADGSHQWSKRFGGSSVDLGYSAGVDSGGNVFLTGYFLSSTIDLGSGALANAGGFDTFVAKYDASGVHQWSKALGGTGTDQGLSITLDGSGNPVITGSFNGTTNLGGALLNSASIDIFVAKYSGVNGAHQWSRRFGGTGTVTETGHSISVDGSGNIFVTGEFRSPVIDFGGGPLTNATTTGQADIFVAKLKK